MSDSAPVDTAPYSDSAAHRPPPRRAGHDREFDGGDRQVGYLKSRAVIVSAVIVVAGAAAVTGALLAPAWAVTITVIIALGAVVAMLAVVALASREVRDAYALASRSRREAEEATAALARHNYPTEEGGHPGGQHGAPSTAWTDATSPAATLFTDSANLATNGIRNGDAVADVRGGAGGFPGRGQVFAKHARRLQVLLNYCLARLDRLEKAHEDPDLLAGLFEVDHGVVQARRQAANLAILAGELPQRRSATPVKIYPVLRAVLQEIQRYTQAVILPTPKVSLNGSAVVEIIHLLAELLDNATQYSDPDGDPVNISTRLLHSGALCVKIADNGLGLPDEDIDRVNRILDGSDPREVELLLNEHRTGLVVAAELARRNGIRVALEKNVYEGVTAVVILPPSMVELDQPSAEPASPRRGRESSSLPTTTAPAAAALPAASGEPQPPRERPEARTRRMNDPVPVAATTSGAWGSEPAPALTAAATGPAPAPQSAPQRVPVNGSGSFGGRNEGTGQHHRVGDEPASGPQGLPDLPVRRSRDAAMDRAAADDNRPPLPVRSRTESRMPEELRTRPSGLAIVPGHSGSLLAGYQEVRGQSAPDSASTDVPPTTRRTDTAWPTT